jgi:hypothetical protein
MSVECEKKNLKRGIINLKEITSFTIGSFSPNFLAFMRALGYKLLNNKRKEAS